MPSEFYEAGPLAQVAINLFYGWGYNFYRLENMLRADDQMIRAKACSLLGEARTSVETADGAYRRDTIAAPTRAKPFPDPAVIAAAQKLERLSQEIGGIEGRIRALPVPEADRMSQLYRQEQATLARLGACDQQLIGQAELLRLKLAGASAQSILADMPLFAEALGAIAETLRDRGALLLAPG